MTQSEIRRAIYLSGLKSTGYEVHHNISGEAIVCFVPSVSIGNLIVNALRARIERRDRDAEFAKHLSRLAR